MDGISMVLRADPASLSVVRERIRRWLAALRWPGEEIDDIVMATNEAVSSAVAHAVAGNLHTEIRVAGRSFAELDGCRRVIVGVAGDGRWEPEPSHPQLRQFGLMLLHTCMDSVETSREDGATTVLMTSVKVPPLP
ncbi:MAG: ATP-binding protein [Pseudonocardia sp.]|nr:ATP-binding protein [Pseudonocardia sp.]